MSGSELMQKPIQRHVSGRHYYFHFYKTLQDGNSFLIFKDSRDMNVNTVRQQRQLSQNIRRCKDAGKVSKKCVCISGNESQNSQTHPILQLQDAAEATGTSELFKKRFLPIDLMAHKH